MKLYGKEVNFSYRDQNAGLNALGYKDMEDEEVKRFNAETLKEYQEKNVEQNNFIFNVYSPEETEKIQNKGNMDALETAQKHHVSELVPYYGSGKAGLESIKIYKNLEKLKKGELLTDEEKEDTRQYIKDMAECELRGKTFGGSLIDGLYATTPFLFEAGIGFMAAGTLNIGVGLSSLGQTASKYALRKGVTNYAKKEIRKQLAAQAKKNAVKKAKQLAVDSTVKLAGFSATATGTEWLKRTGDILLSDDIAVSDRGQYILNEAQSNPAKAVMFALGDTMIENFSETTGVLIGGILGGMGKVIDKTVLNRLPKGFAQNFRKLAEKTFNKPYAKVLRQYGYHGIIEEMGEERIGDFLRVTLNMDEEEGYSFEQFMRALFPDKEQLAQEAILFSLMGGMTAGSIHGTKKAVNYGQYRSFAKDIKNRSKNEDGSYNFDKMKELIKQNNPSVTEEQLEKTVSAITDGIRKVENYSLDDFLIDSGVIRTPYKESITDKRIRNIMKKAGADEESIGTVLNYADNEDKAQLVLSTLQQVNNPETVKEVEDKITSKLLENKSFKNEKDARMTAALFSAPLQKISELTGISLEELAEEEMPEIHRETEQADNGRYIHTDKRIEDIFNEIDNLPDNFNDEEYINQLSKEADILSKIREGNLTDEDYEEANNLINKIETAGNIDLAGELRELTSNQGALHQTIYYQTGHKIKETPEITGARPKKDAADLTGATISISDIQKLFNPDVNIYYQSARNMSNEFDNVVDLSNEFDKTPTLDEVKAYINEVIEQGTKFATLSPDWFVDIRKGARTKKKILNGGNYKGLDKAENARHNKYLMSLEKLLSKAEYAGEKENTKKDKKPNVAKYHYFKTNVKIGGKVYQLIFDTEEYINENPPTARHAKRALKPLSEDTTIITDNKENVKGAGKKSTAAPAQTVHLYNIKEIKKPEMYYRSVNNNPLDYDYIHNQKTGEKIQIEMNEDIKTDKIKPQTISNDLPFNSGGSKSETKKHLFNFLKINVYGKKVKNINTNEIVTINKNTVEKSLSNVGVNESGYKDFVSMLANIEALFKTSQKILSHNDTKNVSNTKISRYANIAKAGGNNYLLEFVVKKGGGISLYSVDLLNKETVPANVSVNKTSTPDTANISITDIKNIFKSKLIKRYNNDYKQKNRLTGDDIAQLNFLYDNVTPRELQEEKYKGWFIPAENLIQLLKNGDESTIVHEFAHWWLDRLVKYSQYNEELALDLEEVRKFLKNDGGEFTRDQHEKFAAGFEVYIRSGSARSNRLKKIFEDFKNALLQIYDSIRSIVYTADGTQYSFSEDEVKNLEKLFERLLTTENERIKKTVFDRCDDINDRIKEIKEYQEQEMKELDEIWKGNIKENNRKSDKKRKVQEYLDLAEGAGKRVPKEVREMKKRYKDVTLDILATATGMSKNAVANPRNREKVERLINNNADNIYASGGMHSEWAEFYEDTGVSYENEELGEEYNLAQKAYKVMLEGNYDFGMNEDEIGDFYGKFDYLYNKVMQLKGEEKETAFEALSTLYDNMPALPDEVMADIAQKLGEAGKRAYESQKEDFNKKRYPNIPVLRQLQWYVTRKLNELKVYNPDVKYKVRINKSHTLYKAIKNATSVNSTKKIIRKINEYVIADLENQAKSILHKEIQKQIHINSKVGKIGAVKKGKFDWRTNTVFQELVQLNKLKQKDALKEYKALIQINSAIAGEERESNDENPISTPEWEKDFGNNLKRKFLEYRAHKIKDLNLALTRSLLEDIMTLKFEGRRAKDELALKAALQKENTKTDLAARLRLLKKNKAARGIARWIMGETPITSEKTLVNWETAINALFGKEAAQKYSLLKLESDAEVYAYQRYNTFCQKAIELYGLDKSEGFGSKLYGKFNKFIDYSNIQPLVKLMQQYENETDTYSERTYSKETGQYVDTSVELSRAEIITLYTWSLNDELEQRLYTQFGTEQVNRMFDTLTEEDKQFAWLLIDTCDSMYEDTNEVFIRTTGLSLPKVQNYFPSKTVRIGSEIDMLHENTVRSSNPSFIKLRKFCNRIKMKPENPIGILLPHINKTARYVILSERVNYLNTIFKDATVRAALKEVFDGLEPSVRHVNEDENVDGINDEEILLSAENQPANAGRLNAENLNTDKKEDGAVSKFLKKFKKRGKNARSAGERIHTALLNQLACSTFENYARGINTGKSFMDYVAANYISSRIGGNLKVMFGQLVSCINYAENMPAGKWAIGFGKAISNPEETVKYMFDNCPYLKARLGGNSMNEIMQKITDEADRFRSLRNFCMTNTKYGDIGAIVFGGKPYVDYLISQGMTQEAAFEKFVEDTLRAQQASLASATSVWQKKQAENPLARMIFAFNNTNLQYERKFLDSISAFSKGDIALKDFVKSVLIYKVFNPIIFTSFLGNLAFMNILRGIFDGDDDEMKKGVVDIIYSILTANLGAYGYMGMALSTIWAFALAMFDKKEYKPFLSTIPIIGDMEKIGTKLILKNEIGFDDWVEAMAIAGDDLTGIPVSRTVNTIGGMADIYNGRPLIGGLRIYGYGNYKATKAVTGEAP